MLPGLVISLDDPYIRLLDKACNDNVSGGGGQGCRGSSPYH